MKRLAILLLLLPWSVRADWSTTDKVMYGLMTGLTLADYGQTRSMTDRYDEGFYETSRWVGRYPSKNRIRNHFATVFLVQNVGVWNLSSKYRTGFQVYFIVDHGAAVLGNLRLGLKVDL